MVLEAELDRKIDVARTVMQRLDSGELLSAVLSLVKTLAGLEADEVIQFLVDLLSYGIDDVPGIKPPFKTPVQQAAGLLYMDLCKAADVRSLTVDSVVAAMWDSKKKERDHTVSVSVPQMERSGKAPKLSPNSGARLANDALRIDLYYAEVQEVLGRVRSFTYDYASRIWQDSLQKKDNIQLLGPDYQLILDSIHALDSEVRDELDAVLHQLNSENPASWALSALGCRNVVLKLGRLLWNVAGDDYHSALLDRTLNLKGDAEKNKLSAYIDFHWQREEGRGKQLLQEAHKLVGTVYDLGTSDLSYESDDKIGRW